MIHTSYASVSSCYHGKLSYLDLFWFSSITWFTIGYGDIIPKTNILKIIVIIKLFINYIIISI